MTTRAAWAAHMAEPATAARRTAGAKGQRVGATAEKSVQEAVERWEQAGRTALTKGHPGMRYAGQLRGRAVFEAKGTGTVDYIGLLHGVPVAFDVKATTKPTFSANTSSVPDHEMDYLRLHHGAGGYAFLLVCVEAQTRPRWAVWRLFRAQGDEWGWTRTDLRTLDDLPSHILGHRATTGDPK